MRRVIMCFGFVYETKILYLYFIYRTISNMDKEQIKQIIGENQEFVKDITFMECPFTFEDAGNYVFLGIRRAGKSYLMYQRIHQLLKKGHIVWKWMIMLENKD